MFRVSGSGYHEEITGVPLVYVYRLDKDDLTKREHPLVAVLNDVSGPHGRADGRVGQDANVLIAGEVTLHCLPLQRGGMKSAVFPRLVMPLLGGFRSQVRSWGQVPAGCSIARCITCCCSSCSRGVQPGFE